tara:strand:- start:1134 stop:2105 length:972 start_codon:yes stop_codon:yes gene_type:complete
MILIISDENDVSTSEVIRWLDFYNAPWIRLNEDDIIIVHWVTIDEFEFTIKGSSKKLSSKEITSFWYRRGYYNISFDVNFSLAKEQTNQKEIIGFLERELKTLKKYIIDIIESKHGLGSFYENHRINKLTNLSCAKSVGLNTPLTGIFTRKNDLIESLKKHDLITKPLTDGFIQSEDFRYYGYTSEIKNDDLNDIDDCFFPSVFQEKLIKKFEIRTFYLDGEMFSVAIFSQDDPKTAVDFRNYNRTKPNRTPTVNLNDNLMEQIRELMNKLGYKSGSLDFVVTNDDRVVFLEVNPIGQFEQVSVPGNYYIEKKIAKYLINDSF